MPPSPQANGYVPPATIAEVLHVIGGMFPEPLSPSAVAEIERLQAQPTLSPDSSEDMPPAHSGRIASMNTDTDTDSDEYQARAVRERCLSLAHGTMRLAGEGDDAEAVINRARRYADFVFGASDAKTLDATLSLLDRSVKEISKGSPIADAPHQQGQPCSRPESDTSPAAPKPAQG